MNVVLTSDAAPSDSPVEGEIVEICSTLTLLYRNICAHTHIQKTHRVHIMCARTHTDIKNTNNRNEVNLLQGADPRLKTRKSGKKRAGRRTPLVLVRNVIGMGKTNFNRKLLAGVVRQKLCRRKCRLLFKKWKLVVVLAKNAYAIRSTLCGNFVWKGVFCRLENESWSRTFLWSPLCDT